MPDLDGCSSIRTAQLPVSGGFHSKFMLPAVPMLADALEKVSGQTLASTMMMPVTRPLTKKGFHYAALTRFDGTRGEQMETLGREFLAM